MIAERRIWIGMHDRCRNDPKYAGRGIAVCDRWQSFTNFFADMRHRPSADHSIDRIDNNGHYSPENCRWATREQQANNARSNIPLVEVAGQKMTLVAACKLLGLNYPVITRRWRRGWPFERLLEPHSRELKRAARQQSAGGIAGVARAPP